jgi:hypothetical protein
MFGWWIDTPSHWVRCEILSRAMGRAVVRLYNETQTRTGKYRQSGDALLVQAERK